MVLNSSEKVGSLFHTIAHFAYFSQPTYFILFLTYNTGSLPEKGKITASSIQFSLSFPSPVVNVLRQYKKEIRNSNFQQNHVPLTPANVEKLNTLFQPLR